MSKARRRKLVRSIILIIACVVVAVLGAVYYTSNSVPNPFWGMLNGTYSYSPSNSSPPQSLFDARPDIVAFQYFRDYVSVDNTYPCAQDLKDYRQYNDDEGFGHCLVVRPVSSIVVNQVEIYPIYIEGLFSGNFGASIFYKVTYSDRSQFKGILLVPSYSHSSYFRRGFLHLNCWSFGSFYEQATSNVPKGVDYVDPNTGLSRCNK